MDKEPTYNQIENQTSVLVPRSDGRIVVGNRVERDGRLFADFTDSDSVEKSLEALDPRAFSDEVQEHYADVLAGSAGRPEGSYVQPAMPTKDNPETIEYDEGSKPQLIKIPRNGNRPPTDMYKRQRYVDEQGRQWYVMVGVQQEEFPDGEIGYPQKHLLGKEVERLKNEQDRGKSVARVALSRQDSPNLVGGEGHAPELSEKDKILQKVPILKLFLSELAVIAQVRKTEASSGPRYGMDQFTSSNEMIHKLVESMTAVEKPKTLSENRTDAILRYIELI